jgi:hypothetical protein
VVRIRVRVMILQHAPHVRLGLTLKLSKRRKTLDLNLSQAMLARELSIITLKRSGLALKVWRFAEELLAGEPRKIRGLAVRSLALTQQGFALQLGCLAMKLRSLAMDLIPALKLGRFARMTARKLVGLAIKSFVLQLVCLAIKLWSFAMELRGLALSMVGWLAIKLSWLAIKLKLSRLAMSIGRIVRLAMKLNRLVVLHALKLCGLVV